MKIKGKASTPTATPAAVAATPVQSGPVAPLFRRIDWWTALLAFAVVWVVYYLTLAPQVTLEDSGELTTASYWAGIPHPPGYPFWTIYTWLWTVLVPFKNIAWRVALAEASTEAFACGILALMVSRGSSMLMEGIEELKGMTGKWETAICMVCGVISGLLLGFGSSMWKESVVINRISPFGVPWLMLVLVFLLRWIYAPHQRRYLYAAMFCFGICWTIHQTLMLAAMGLEIGIAMCHRKLGRDLFLANSVMFLIGVLMLDTGMAPGLANAASMVRVIFFTVGVASVGVCIWLAVQTGGILSEWKTILFMGLVFAIGIGFYFYEPLAGMTNPPMEWGYPRTVDGFFEALSRGQYNKVTPTDIFRDPYHFLIELVMLVQGVADAYSWVYMFFALLPLFFFFKMQRRERAWIGLVASIYPFLGILLSIFLSPTRDRQTADLVKTFFIASHAIVAIMIGYGLALTAAYMATHYKEFRRWGIVGGCAAIFLAVYNLWDATGKHYFGVDGTVNFFQLPHWIAQAFAPRQYGLPIFANLILLAVVIAFIVALVVYRARAPLLITLGLFGTMPLYSGMSHWFHCEQHNHWFGYWYGHDMFTPPFVGSDGKMTYDPKQRDAAAKGPDAKMVYPEMARDAVLFGGTDPGRFCPTYMIFAESFIPHSCQPEQDTNFDRRDVYLITQNALVDLVYLNYIRAQFNRSAQVDPPFFQELLPGAFPKIFHKPTKIVAFLDDIFESIGAKIEFRRRTGTSWFEPDQFTNISDLATKLREGKDNLSKYLYGRLNKATQELAGGSGDEKKLRRVFAEDFNAILSGGNIYDAERFKGVQLPPLIVSALNRTNIEATTIRLNRRMLEEAYPGDIAKSLGGVYPDTEIETPTPDDQQQCVNDYYQDLANRKRHDIQSPNEPHQVRSDEDVQVEDGRIKIAGSQSTVMNINGLLTKVIFDKNPDHEFYVEESAALQWMYPYLTPYGIIMKVNRQPLAEITQDIIDKDHAFWSRYGERTIGNWITYDTSIKDICEWADKVYLRHDFSDFKGDMRFMRDDDAQKNFCKLRSAIGASIYLWRARNPHSEAERIRTTREAEFALKQAFAYSPYSGDAVYNLMNLELSQGRLDDAILLLKACHNLDPFNGQVNNLIEQLERNRAQPAQRKLDQIFGGIEQDIAAKRVDAASQKLDQLLKSPDADASVMLNVGAMYLRMNNLPKSEEAFGRLTQLMPASSEAWYNLALVQANRGENAQAVASLVKALRLNPGDRKQNPGVADLVERYPNDSAFAGLRQTPDYKAAFTGKP